MTARDDTRDAAPGRPAGRRVAITAGALVLLALALAAPADAEWGPVPPEAWQEPARPDSGGADAILLLDHSECHDLLGVVHMEYFGRARVFTREGCNAGTIHVPYVKGLWKLSNVRARSMLPNGLVTEFDPAQVVETTVLRSGDYDLASATIAVPGVEPGCIIEWAYTLDGKVEKHSGWRFDFANRIYTCVSSHTWWRSSSYFDTEPELSWRYRGISSELVNEKCEPACARPKTITFTVLCQPGVGDEELAPPAEDATPRVTVFYGSRETTDYWSWWKSRLDQDQERLNEHQDALRKLVGEIRARYSEPESALAGVYNWVQGHLQSLDELPWDRRERPGGDTESYRGAKSIDDLLGHREATPVEINCLMAAAARDLGFVAAVGFVGDRRFEVFDRLTFDFPQGGCITVVFLADGAIGLEPSSRFTPFGSLPWYLRGGDCLLSGQTEKLFLLIPPDFGGSAKALWNMQARLDTTGTLEGHIEARLSGEEGAQWKRDLWEQDPERWKAILKDRLAENGSLWADFEAPRLDTPPDSEFVLRAAVRWPDAASVTGNHILVSLKQLIPWRSRANLRPGLRRQPVLFRYPREEVIRAEIELSSGLTVDHVPDPQHFENEAGGWSVQWTRAGSLVEVERRLVLRSAQYPARACGVVRELFQSLEQADQSVLLVTGRR